jgi:hypothetical protein
MSAKLQLVGMRFGRLTVTDSAGAKHGVTMWRCECDCGGNKEIRGSRLVQGKTSSCGCLVAETMRSMVIKHGATGTRTYKAWDSMKQRCFNPKSQYFAAYGGRGISVCARWMESFENFFTDMGDPPEGMSLDRFPDVDGNYEPGNCRWATDAQQSRNRRTSIFVAFNGETKCISEWAECLGMNYSTVRHRLKQVDPSIAFNDAAYKQWSSRRRKEAA